MLYLTLADVRRKRDSGDTLSLRLTVLGMRKLAAAGEVPAGAAELFREQFGDQLGMDYGDPATYAAIAQVLERANQEPEPPESRERLLPYRLLTDLQEQAPSSVGDELLVEIRSHAARCAPVLHAALREWARHPAALDDKAVAMVAALLGESPIPALPKICWSYPDSSTVSSFRTPIGPSGGSASGIPRRFWRPSSRRRRARPSRCAAESPNIWRCCRGLSTWPPSRGLCWTDLRKQRSKTMPRTCSSPPLERSARAAATWRRKT
jgi:hypothetical protein